MFQLTRKNTAGTFKFRQVVPNMHWEVVPSPVVEVRAPRHPGLDLRLAHGANHIACSCASHARHALLES